MPREQKMRRKERIIDDDVIDIMQGVLLTIDCFK